MKKKEEQIHIEKLKQDWQQLDELADNKSITAMSVKQQLVIHQEKQKRRFYKELLIFFMTAVCILSVGTISVVQAPALFLAIEIGASLLGPIVYYFLVKRRKKEGKATHDIL